MAKKLDVLAGIAQNKNLDYIDRQQLDGSGPEPYIPDDLEEHQFTEEVEEEYTEPEEDDVDLASEDNTFLDKFAASKSQEDEQAAIEAQMEAERQAQEAAEEERRKAAEVLAKKREEEERKAEEERQARIAAENERKAAEKRAKEEAERKAKEEAERKAAEQEAAAQQAALDAQKREEEARKAEEKKKLTKVSKHNSDGSLREHESLDASNLALDSVSGCDEFTAIDKKILIRMIIMARDNVSFDDDLFDEEDINIMWNRLAYHIGCFGESDYQHDFTKTDKKIAKKIINATLDNMPIENNLLDADDVKTMWRRLLKNIDTI